MFAEQTSFLLIVKFCGWTELFFPFRTTPPVFGIVSPISHRFCRDCTFRGFPYFRKRFIESPLFPPIKTLFFSPPFSSSPGRSVPLFFVSVFLGSPLLAVFQRPFLPLPFLPVDDPLAAQASVFHSVNRFPLPSFFVRALFPHPPPIISTADLLIPTQERLC